MISSARLAWLQLRRQKVRLTVALAGVAFAVILMTMQMGFQDALFRSAVNVHMRLRGDLFLVHANYNVLAFPTSFARRRLYQALAFEGVESVTPVYTGLARWHNPENDSTREIYVLGIDPAGRGFDNPDVEAALHTLKLPDQVLFDSASRPEYGPVAARFNAGRDVTTEANQRRVTVAGLFRMGASFGIDGSLVTSDLNFLRILPHHTPAKVGIGLVRLRPGADAAAVRDAMTAQLPRDVRVITRDEYYAHEINHWARATPIGFVFSFGVFMGVVVGMIIVYQILFADIAEHLTEYATLKAMGYTNTYLSLVVLVEATILAVVGFLPGQAACMQLYAWTKSATQLPMEITALRTAQVLGLTVAMCWISAFIALRKLRAADPADVF
jgi:putative ABC transport system permease protein